MEPIQIRYVGAPASVKRIPGRAEGGEQKAGPGPTPAVKQGPW